MRISWKSRAISAGNTPIQQRSRLPMIGNSSDRNRTNDRIGDGIPPERTPHPQLELPLPVWYYR